MGYIYPCEMFLRDGSSGCRVRVTFVVVRQDQRGRSLYRIQGRAELGEDHTEIISPGLALPRWQVFPAPALFVRREGSLGSGLLAQKVTGALRSKTSAENPGSWAATIETHAPHEWPAR